MILGAATGILSGGVTLIGGAAAGVVGGAVMGALFHKSLGLTDADKERLELYLQDGGAALVVMADEHEVEPTKAELARLGGRVEDYQVPEETMEQVEESTDVEPVAEEDIPAVTAVSGRVGTVQGIGPARVAALAAIGITTKQALLERGATPAGRAEIAEQSKISEKLIAGWVSAVDLSRVKGIGAQMGELLQAAGVTTVGDLAQQEAASLHEQLLAVNATRKLVRQVPGVSQIENVDRPGQGICRKRSPPSCGIAQPDPGPSRSASGCWPSEVQRIRYAGVREAPGALTSDSLPDTSKHNVSVQKR